MNRLLLFILGLCLLAGCSSEPTGDEFTGIWSDGDNHRMEFLAPNAVVWQKLVPGTRRSYKDKNGRRVEDTVTSAYIRLGLYERDGDTLRIYWVGKRNTSGYLTESIFDLEAVEENRLEMNTDDARWNRHSARGKEQPLRLTMKRDETLASSTAELKGVWRSDRHGVKVIDSLGHEISLSRNLVNRYKQAEVDGPRLKLIRLNPFPTDETKVWYWRKSGGKLSLLSQGQMDRGEDFDKAEVYNRWAQPLRMTSGSALKFEDDTEKR